ncbi:glycerophosphodiester phosphodiesterase [Streptomyces sp. URMC 125]|uniref:glycerophosphodiester phosphodiesterase n=1 Tax=Streptomyces sp. URMC 125 TaxID=3423419 RepID=UPI003F1B604C
MAIRTRVLTSLTAALVLALASAGCQETAALSESAVEPCSAPAGIAHRGSPGDGAPENTMAAFTAAVADRADGLELDVWWTGDGVPVVMHDDTVDRTTDGTGRTTDLSAADLWRLDAGRGERVPTLDQPLEHAAAHDVTVVVELKQVPTEAQARSLLETVRRAGAADLVTVSSFETRALEVVRRTAPDLPTALTVGKPVSAAEAARHGTTLLMHHRHVTRERVAQWHAAGLTVYAWTPDLPREWERVRAAGADGVITDEVASYRTWAAAACR